MLKVGITGGIGSGKTTACKLFTRLYGIPVYYADQRAKHIMNFNSQVKEKVKNLLGNEAYYKNGRLNRAQVSKIVFKNKGLLSGLNKIVHPAIQEDGINWFKSLSKKHPYALKEAALLFESNSYKTLDKIIVVHVDNDIRIKRVMDRDGVTKKKVMARINNQMSQKLKMKKADFLLHNDSRLNLKKQVESVHLQLLALSK